MQALILRITHSCLMNSVWSSIPAVDSRKTFARWFFIHRRCLEDFVSRPRNELQVGLPSKAKSCTYSTRFDLRLLDLYFPPPPTPQHTHSAFCFITLKRQQHVKCHLPCLFSVNCLMSCADLIHLRGRVHKPTCYSLLLMNPCDLNTFILHYMHF